MTLRIEPRRAFFVGFLTGIIFFTPLLAFVYVGASPLMEISDTSYTGSMRPTLWGGDRILYVHSDKIERGDIVSFVPPHNEDERYVKRVIGLPGEEVFVQNEKVTII